MSIFYPVSYMVRFDALMCKLERITRRNFKNYSERRRGAKEILVTCLHRGHPFLVRFASRIQMNIDVYIFKNVPSRPFLKGEGKMEIKEDRKNNAQSCQ